MLIKNQVSSLVEDKCISFKCNLNMDGKNQVWDGKIISYKEQKDMIEMNVEGRGSWFHIIIGKTKFGNYACIPNFEVGCYLSKFNDVFWNTEKLTSLIGIIDGITVSKAIECIKTE